MGWRDAPVVGPAAPAKPKWADAPVVDAPAHSAAPVVPTEPTAPVVPTGPRRPMQGPLS